MSHIKTAYFDAVSRECPLPEYPRPQFVREGWQCLNGLWDYAVTDANSSYPTEYDGQILVPFSVETALSGVEKTFLPTQRLWYRRSFTVDPSITAERKILQFGAVDYRCKVFVNRTLVFEHTGGYNPFHADITDALNPGGNELVVYVEDPTETGPQQRGKQVLESHGFWYTATSGIWQTVWLEGRNSSYIRRITVLPEPKKNCVLVNSRLRLPGDGEGFSLDAEVSLDGKTVFSGTVGPRAKIPMKDFEYWSPENPVLYDLKLTLRAPDGTVADEIRSYFGMRYFSIEQDGDGISRLCLNGKKYFQKGLLDQGYFPDGGLTPPSDEAMINDIRTAKDLGFNMLRKHIKVEPDRWYYHCDRLGMLVWQDMVSGGEYIGTVTAGVLPLLKVKLKDDDYKRFSRGELSAREEFKTQLKEMIDALHNHPSICCWVPFNEGWGQFDALAIANWVKSYDPSRFVDHASGWYDQGGPDFLSMHRYTLPITMPKLDTRPFVISEYGGYSRTVDGHVWNKAKSFGYVAFGSTAALSKAFRKLHERQVIPLIGKGLCATVYTQLTDVEFEVNGMMTYDRAVVKLDPETVREVNGKLTYGDAEQS
ncbi:MAG: glycoside hydrolase family 2 [Clostridia bacterium]|nr:glycoside hydrolase family 2 [Clostridia bacterium]